MQESYLKDKGSNMENKIQYQKKEVIQRIKQLMESKLTELEKTYEKQRQLASDLPGPMQSRYDSSKAESSWIIAGIENRIDQIKGEIGVIDNYPFHENPQFVILGSLVRIGHESGGYNDYIILPYGGGTEIEVKGNLVTTITPQSPLANATLGKKKGDEIILTLEKRVLTHKVLDFI